MIAYTAKGSVEIVETKLVTLYAKRGICRSTFCLASGMTTPSTRDTQTDRRQEDWIDPGARSNEMHWYNGYSMSWP